ncbi:hypothetical protein [Trueperella sp. LYQ143]|uniref:hypothetical protein n=1 Tax=unclassified Trueperella TaxID=2630174 RepID=UPI00398311E3
MDCDDLPQLSQNIDPAKELLETVVPEQPVRQGNSRRVVRLSRVDAQRIQSGELAGIEAAVHATDARPMGSQVASASAGRSGRPARSAEAELSARDREILGDLPPHFGKL